MKSSDARGKVWHDCASCLLFLHLLTCTSPAAAQTVGRTFEDLFARASVAREQDNPSQAIELYTQAIQLNPKSADAWWFLGLLQYRSGSYGPATAALSRYLELTPDAAPALALRGLCEFETGEYQQSLVDIRKAISLGAANDPRNRQILRYHEALLLTRLGRFRDALKSYSFFADNQITNPELFVAIGLAGLEMPLLPASVSADRQGVVAATGSAAFQFMSGDQKGAQQAFQALFQRFPTASTLHYLLGYLLFTTDPEGALAEFQRELQVTPENLNAQIMTAWVLEMRSRAAEALPYAQRAVHQKPNLPTAQLILGRSLMDIGDLNGSIEHLEQALKLDSNDLEIHIALAKAYSKSGRKEEARSERMLCLQLTRDAGTQLASR